MAGHGQGDEGADDGQQRVQDHHAHVLSHHADQHGVARIGDGAHLVPQLGHLSDPAGIVRGGARARPHAR